MEGRGQGGRAGDDDDDDDGPASDPDALQRHAAAVALHITRGETIDEMWATGPGDAAPVPKRYLPNQSRAELYSTFRAHEISVGAEPASNAIFLRVFKACFGKCLGFRRKKEFPECDQCSRLKEAVRKAPTNAVRKVALENHELHNLEQWLDRQIYWRWRFLSCQFFMAARSGVVLPGAAYAASVLTVISDGMDQAKFRIPRYRRRVPSGVDSLQRPQLHVTGTWAHGVCLQWAVAEEDLHKDANTAQDAIARALNKVYERYGALPRGLVLQQAPAP